MFAGEGERREEKLGDEEGPGGSVENAGDGQEVGGLVEAADVLADVRHQPLAVGLGLENEKSNIGTQALIATKEYKGDSLPFHRGLCSENHQVRQDSLVLLISKHGSHKLYPFH